MKIKYFWKIAEINFWCRKKEKLLFLCVIRLFLKKLKIKKFKTLKWQLIKLFLIMEEKFSLLKIIFKKVWFLEIKFYFLALWLELNNINNNLFSTFKSKKKYYKGIWKFIKQEFSKGSILDGLLDGGFCKNIEKLIKFYKIIYLVIYLICIYYFFYINIE